MEVNKVTHNKANKQPYDPDGVNGYQPRPLGYFKPSTIIIHTTNGNKGTTSEHEADYILNSRSISAHYLIGKSGELYEFLDPMKYIAYHAGCVKAIKWSNIYAIGIEIHNTPKEGAVNTQQKATLDTLVRYLIQKFKIDYTHIDTHRNVAVFCKPHIFAGKLGRKIDPSGFSDIKFYAWRDSLKAPLPIHTDIYYKVKSPKGVNIRQSPSIRSDNISGTLVYGDVFIAGDIKKDENNRYINGTNLWVHVLKGMSQGKDVSQLGFVHMGNLVRL